LDDTLANAAITQLLLASRTAPEKTIDLYIDSADGLVTSALALYDVLQTLGTPVATTCTGTAGGAVVLVLAAGARGRRAAMPHARIQVSDDPVDMGSTERQVASDPATLAEEARRATARWRAALIQHVAQSPSQLAADLASGRWLSASEALDYGLIDQIVARR
jgi:ATP-dependent Clp protease protease subunit